jgi:hypothetical protein
MNYPGSPELFMYELKSWDTLPISENRYMSLISMHIVINTAEKIMFMNNSGSLYDRELQKVK